MPTGIVSKPKDSVEITVCSSRRFMTSCDQEHLDGNNNKATERLYVVIIQ